MTNASARLSIVLALVGCGNPAPPPASRPGTSGSTSICWLSERKGGGFDFVAATRDGLPGGHAIVVWSDCVSVRGSFAMTQNGFSSERSFAIPGSDAQHAGGKSVVVEVRLAPDGRTGEVTIDGAKFDFAAGNVFLIAAAHGPLKTRQLRREFGNLAFDRTSIEEIERTDAEIGRFFSTAKGSPARSEP